MNTVREIDKFQPTTSFSFDETLGTIMFSETNNSLYNDMLILEGNTDWSEYGMSNTAIRFNGNDSGAKIANSANINLGIHDQHTIAFWFQADDVSVADRKQVLYEQGGASRGINIYLDDGQLYVGAWNTPIEESNWQGTWLSTAAIQSGQWHHIAFVLSGNETLEDDALIAYLDGEEFGRGAGSQLWEHIGEIGLGNIQGKTRFAPTGDPLDDPVAEESQGHGFSGLIDEFVLYNRALDLGAIEAVIREPLTPQTSFRFDEGIGTTVTELPTQGLQVDQAIFQGAVRWSQDAVRGHAVRFDNSGFNNSVIQIENSLDINLDTAYPQRTIEFWFKADNIDLSEHKQVLYEEGGALRGLNVYLYEGQLHVGAWNALTDESNWQGTWLSTPAITRGQWHHVALVLDGTPTVEEEALIAYLDGEEFGRGNGSQLWAHSGDIGLGNVKGKTLFAGLDPLNNTIADDTGKYGFSGILDEFNLYNRALTEAQVRSLLNNTIRPVTTFDFNAPADTVVDQANRGLQPDRAHLQGTVNWINDGLEGFGIHFEDHNSAVHIENSADINLGTYPQRTISLWFLANDVSVSDRKQVLYEEGGPTRGLNIYLDNGQLVVGGWNAIAEESNWQGTWLSTAQTPVQVNSGQWHHVALVLKGDETVQNDSLIAYLDGQEFGRGVGSQLWEHPGDIGLGNIKGKTVLASPDDDQGIITAESEGHGFIGVIDQFSVYDYALNAEAINELVSGYIDSDDDQNLEVFTVSPTIIGLRLEVNDIEDGGQIPYIAEAEDNIDSDGWLRRNGQEIGRVVGANQDTLYVFDRAITYDLNTDWAAQVSSYHLTSQTDANYGAETAPTSVFRKSKIIDTARTGIWDFEFRKAHTIFLELDQPLNAGDAYTIDFQANALGDGTILFPDQIYQAVDFIYDPLNTRSEAVHVSQIGFDPDDDVKVAFLSTWLGEGDGNPNVSYQAGQTFWLVDEVTNQIVYSGAIELAQAVDDPSNFSLNYNLTDVYRMNFGDFQTPGNYRVCVDGVGCSFSFEIGEQVWDDAFYTGVRGLYHQRSGISLEQPYTDWERPRSLHPDDGLTVYQSTAMLVNTGEGYLGGPSFGPSLIAGNTGEIVENAWGGWHDAGDWDRRIQHTRAVRQLLELVELDPTYFENSDLNLPESTNHLPDVLDEALWGLDVFRRLQREDGAVSGGIEGPSTPEFGVGSWNETEPWYVYAPDAWSSHEYAAAAAKAAYVLQAYDPTLAQVYQESAIRAMEWAEANPISDEILQDANDNRKTFIQKDVRSLASAELYRLTGDDRWHQIFLETTAFNTASPYWNQHQLDAAFAYINTTQPGQNTTVEDFARSEIIRQADFMIGENAGFGFGELLDRWTPVGWGASGAGLNRSQSLVRSHVLTGDAKYRDALIKATQFGLGANPDNLVYTTGLGHRSPNSPLIEDMAALGTTPPPGIGVYGPFDLQRYGWIWSFNLHPDDVTAQNLLPVNESYQDFYYDIPITEFTVMQTIAMNAYVWGYLAASDLNLQTSEAALSEVTLGETRLGETIQTSFTEDNLSQNPFLLQDPIIPGVTTQGVLTNQRDELLSPSISGPSSSNNDTLSETGKDTPVASDTDSRTNLSVSPSTDLLSNPSTNSLTNTLAQGLTGDRILGEAVTVPSSQASIVEQLTHFSLQELPPLTETNHNQNFSTPIF